MPRLIAIVGDSPKKSHGEAFLWYRNNRDAPIAIDAGANGDVGRISGMGRPRILVLSHDDHDHIGGALSLIGEAASSLEELWVPAEWSILLDQIAASSSSPVAGLPDGDLPDGDVSNGEWPDDGIVRVVGEDRIYDGQRNSGAEGRVVDRDILDRAVRRILVNTAEIQNDWEFDGVVEYHVPAYRATLEQWERESSVGMPRFGMAGGDGVAAKWYGAGDVADIIKRVRFRATAIGDILSAAVAAGIAIRFFSIDAAIAMNSFPQWETEGRPGVATIANGREVQFFSGVSLPPGLPVSFALTKLTVQNRRALCTLLWASERTCFGGGLIWSDTDGNWLDYASGNGFDAVVKDLRACSAPHHASGNAAHDRAWDEIGKMSQSAPMISAGGQWNQTYRVDYLNHGALNGSSLNRCCTWCRRLGHPIQGVTVQTSRLARSGRLLNNCTIVH